MRTVEHLLQQLRAREPDVPLFHQAVEPVARSVWPLLHSEPRWNELKIFDRLLLPDREIRFRVEWVDDAGEVQVETGWRIQHSNLLGPYKGGLRFTPDLDRSALRFLAFEQTFKGALTGLPLGGAKGGATFNPKGRSEAEVMRFCQAFIRGLVRFVGPRLDVPAGDMNVGAREIGFLFGAYRQLREESGGAFTGRPIAAGGIPLRVEATGYGLVIACREVLKRSEQSLEGKTCLLSGAGNVALHAAEKLIAMGAKVLTLSDTGGTLHTPKGLDAAGLNAVRRVKTENGGSLSAVARDVGGAMTSSTPWEVGGEVALPCATQNELDAKGAKALLRSGVQLVAEGANMPCTTDAVAAFDEALVTRLPGKLSNAGGVTVSGFEMAQDAQLIPWDEDVVAQRLDERMTSMVQCCAEHGQEGGRVSFEKGANLVAFRKLAQVLESRGVL